MQELRFKIKNTEQATVDIMVTRSNEYGIQ